MKKNIVKSIAVFLIMLNITLLTGCWNYTEIDEQINVAGLAVDVGEKDKKYHLSAEILNIGKGKQGEITTEVIESDGNTIIECMRDMIRVTSKKLYFGHCKTIIIGEDLAKEGIVDLIDLLIRDNETRMAIDVLVSKGMKGKDVLSTKGINNPIISYEMEDMLITGEKFLAKCPRLQVYQIIDDFKTEGICSVLPAFVITKVKDYDTFKSSGVGVFREDRLVGYLTPDETQTLSIVKNEVKNAVLSVPANEKEESFIGFEIIEDRTKIEPKIKDGKLSVNIVAKENVNMVETEVSFETKKEQDKIKRLIENKIEEDILSLAKKAQDEFECDIFGIGMTISKDYPEIWHKYEKGWDETYKNLDINADCAVILKGSGINNRVIGFGD